MDMIIVEFLGASLIPFGAAYFLSLKLGWIKGCGITIGVFTLLLGFGASETPSVETFGLGFLKTAPGATLAALIVFIRSRN